MIPAPPTPTPLPVLGAVRVTLPGLLDTLNPLLSRSTLARAVASLVFSSLVAAAPDGQPVPALATRWRSADGLTWTFHLDPTRHWQDGEPVTSTDVAYTLALIQAPGSPVDPALHAAWQGIQVSAPDAATVTLTVPVTLGAGILDLATVPILPAHLLAATPMASLRLLPFSSRPVGDGAYQVASANVLGATLRVRRSDSLAPRRLIVDGGGDARTTPAPLPGRAGSVALAQARRSPSPGAMTTDVLARPVFVFLNTRDAALRDARVRQALDRAINRSALISGPLRSAAVALHGPLLPGSWSAGGTDDMPPFDPAAASRALDAAGWLGGGHGWRQRDGVPLVVTVLVDSDPTRLAAAQAVAVDWQAIGVKASVQVVGLDGMLRDFVAPGRYQAALVGIRQRGSLPDLAALWHSGGALNVSGWSDPLADAALDATRAADVATQRIGYTRFVRRFVDETPAIPLYLPTVRLAVRGLRLPTGTVDAPADVLRSAERWRPAPTP